MALEISDDGRGFDVVEAASEQGHFGILGMKERSAGIKADFAIESDNTGTHIRLRAPISRPRGQFWHGLRRWRPPTLTRSSSKAMHRTIKA
jgi:signal transduction histidine kinase